ncbi:MAG: type II secretion system GspH family protein [Candidatus Gastranaerophilales bacterium]|nr:type II secretion system GspH family protein [Candidatus Gastranaerophilales bacterium]
MSKKLFAFTLAEVLITLGIIGVVAAMTIPTLMTKIQNRQYATAYKKAYSTLNQALKSANEDGAITSLKGGGYVSEGAGQGKGLVGKNFVVLAQYFAGVTTCFDGDNTACWNCEGEAGLSNNKCHKSNYAFIDASGMQYYLYNNDEWPIIVDVNGFSKPNVLGRDRYVMYFTNSFKKGYYDEDIDAIIPWIDIVTKQRWCPSGDCPYTSRLFGGSTKKRVEDYDNK